MTRSGKSCATTAPMSTGSLIRRGINSPVCRFPKYPSDWRCRWSYKPTTTSSTNRQATTCATWLVRNSSPARNKNTPTSPAASHDTMSPTPDHPPDPLAPITKPTSSLTNRGPNRLIAVAPTAHSTAAATRHR